MLLWGILIFLGLRVTTRLFGKQLLAFGMKKLLGRLQKQAQAQQRAYEAHFGAGDMQDHLYADEEVKVTSKKHHPKPDVHLDDFAQDVEFEEVNE